MTTVEDVIELLENLLAVLTRIAGRFDDEKDRRDDLSATRFYDPLDVTVVRDTATNRVIGYRVQVPS